MLTRIEHNTNPNIENIDNCFRKWVLTVITFLKMIFNSLDPNLLIELHVCDLLLASG